MNAPGHGGLDQGPKVFLGNGSFVKRKPAVVTAISHSDVLQIAFPPLIADGAIKGMVEQQKLKGTCAGTGHHFGGGFDAHPLRHRHGATGDRFRA
jgi:hypothetical protein